jgi:divalent metal cation (Fe/Co/Zn/Cd) transporter
MAGVTIADPLAAMAVATIIAVNAVGLFRENMSFLIGRAPPPEFMAKLEAAARSVPGVKGIHYLHAEYVGPAVIHGDIHIQVEPALTVVESHHIAKQVDLTLEPLMGNGICEVHVDVYRPAPIPNLKGS